MKKVCKVFALTLCVILLAGMPITADTATAVSVSSARIISSEEEDEISLKFTLTSPTIPKEITAILATAEISETDTDPLSKILCIDQIAVPASRQIALQFSRAQAETLLGTKDLEASSLVLMISEKATDVPTTVIVPFVSSEPEVLTGDINADGSISVFDALGLLHALLNNTLDQLRLHAADMNGDGKVSMIDVLRVLSAAAMN